VAAAPAVLNSVGTTVINVGSAVGGFIADTATSIYDSTIGSLATNYNNLRASGLGVFTAAGIAFASTGVENIENAREGRTREGVQLSNTQRVVQLVEGMAQLIPAGIATARIGGALGKAMLSNATGEGFVSKLVCRATGLGCFVAGTPVNAETGLKPIERVAIGERVWACDLSVNEWRLCRVAEVLIFEGEGPLVEVTILGQKIESTYHHPFWVISGQFLEHRPKPDHLVSAQVKNAIVPGRWVDAGDLLAGDVVLLQDGRQVPVEDIDVRYFVGYVYNLTVDGLQNYAVGPDRVLAHNNNCNLAANAIHEHHLLPQQFRVFFTTVGLNIEQFKIPLTAAQHTLKPNGVHTGDLNWNAVWKLFIDANPKAGAPDVLNRLAAMRNMFNI
jgi:hypothetical protein